MANSKDVLFKSKVNNYISEKLSQSDTPPTFSVTDDGNGNYTVGKFNGDVTLTFESGSYVFTPARGDAVTIAVSSVTSIIVDFITLNTDALVLDGETVTGSGVVNLNPFSSIPQVDLTYVQSAVLSATITGGISTPTQLETLDIGDPTIGLVIKITDGEVSLDSLLTIPSYTSIVVETGATLTLTAADSTGLTIEGAGTVNITNLENTLDADLSGIKATTVTAAVAGGTQETPLNLTANLGKAVVTVTSGVVTIGTAATLGTASFVVNSGATLNSDLGKMDGVTVSGEGTATANLTADIDMSNVTTTNGVIGIVYETVNISTNENLDTVTAYISQDDTTLTLTAAQALSKSISGEGNVTVKDIAADTNLSTITATGTLSATISQTLNLTQANLSGLDVLTISDEADTAITVTITPEQYAALVGKVTLGTNDKLVSTDTTIPTSTIASAAFDENTGTLTLTGTNFNTILETTEDATTDVKARLDWSKLSWDINGDDTTTADVSFAVSDIGSAKVTDAATLTITLTNTKTAALIATTGYNETGSSAVDTLDVSAGFIRDMSHNAAAADAAADAVVAITQDTAAPTAASTNPITNTDTNNDSTGVYAAGDKIRFSFSESINTTTLTLADITLDNSHSFGDGATLTAISPSDGFTSTFEITLGTTPTVAANDTLTVASSKAVDIAGNANSSGIDYAVPTLEAAFRVTDTNGVITFEGAATGNISLAIDSGTVTFTKGSVTAATTVNLGNITKITLAAGQTITDSAADLTKPIDGAGSVVVTGTANEDVLYIWTSGTNSITGGTGLDTIWLGDAGANGGVDTMIIANGDSSVGTPDQIVYFELDKDKLDLPSTTIATTSTDVSDVTVGVVTVGKTTITSGIATFQAADNTTSVAITSADALNAALGYLAGAIADTETVAFTYDLGYGNSGTYLFQGNVNGDIIVDFVGITVLVESELSTFLI
ncbi:MAG: hypothetical protein C0627_08425 [Sulfurimonas sp.]|nr:MAG: hypothetical protein C0627_08425 [Sulfurimonas sp.]